MAEPVDPLLPARLRRLAAFVNSELRIRSAWWRALTRFLDFLRPRVMQPYRDSGGAVPPQPSYLPDSSMWANLVDEEVRPELERAMRTTYREVGDEGRFSDDPFVQRYLQDATARMRNLPIEVYADITRILSNGLDDGLSVPDIAAQIEQRLTASGSDYWPNRATTVARTEAIGASNAGAYAAALSDPTPGMNKTWIATLDGRTRPAHREADGQAVPVGDPFIVDGQPLDFPGDPRGSAGNVINCRCSLLVTAPGEELDWTDRQTPERNSNG
jgi:hypothetical protein